MRLQIQERHQYHGVRGALLVMCLVIGSGSTIFAKKKAEPEQKQPCPYLLKLVTATVDDSVWNLVFIALERESKAEIATLTFKVPHGEQREQYFEKVLESGKAQKARVEVDADSNPLEAVVSIRIKDVGATKCEDFFSLTAPAALPDPKRPFAEGVPEKPPEGTIPPVEVKRVAPVYPRAQAMSGGEGRVVMELLLNETGKVADVRVLESSNNRFNASAVSAVRQWEFRPASLHGTPVPSRWNGTLTFQQGK